jgi:preprotein translocase subunit SecG
MLPYLNAAQILVAGLLIALILMQTRGTGFASGNADTSIYRTRRGVERTLFQLTIVISVVFTLLAIASVVIPRFES